MKNYYNILGLETPSLLPSSTSTPRQLDPQSLRRAYKSALLIAHPDKASATANASSNTTSSSTYTYTIDDVKEAYMVLSDAGRRAEYNRLLLAQNRSGIGNGNEEEGERDFILGLEVLDLGDFVEGVSQSSTSSTSTSSSSCDSAVSGEAEGKIEWYRPCRCGAEKGFRIEEDELENAERRGEKEVLVGCEGCSLWVRVGFDVEVEEG